MPRRRVSLPVRLVVDSSAPLNRGLVAWWLVIDRSRPWSDLIRGREGTLVANAAFVGPQEREALGSIALDGNGDYVSLGNPGALEFGSNDFSVCFWAKPRAAHNNQFRFFLSRDADGTQGFSVGKDNNNVAYAFARDAAGDAITATSTYSLTGSTPWTHFAVVRSGSSLNLYINGKLNGSGTNAALGDPLPSGVRWFVGARDATPVSGEYTALVDDVRCYNRALSASVAFATYRASRAGWPAELRRLVLGGAAATAAPPGVDPPAVVALGSRPAAARARGRLAAFEVPDTAAAPPAVDPPAVVALRPFSAVEPSRAGWFTFEVPEATGAPGVDPPGVVALRPGVVAPPARGRLAAFEAPGADSLTGDGVEFVRPVLSRAAVVPGVPGRIILVLRVPETPDSVTGDGVFFVPPVAPGWAGALPASKPAAASVAIVEPAFTESVVLPFVLSIGRPERIPVRGVSVVVLYCPEAGSGVCDCEPGGVVLASAGYGAVLVELSTSYDGLVAGAAGAAVLVGDRYGAVVVERCNC